MSGTLLADAVTWLFTNVLKGLQMHGQHEGCMASLVHLAFQIYEALVSGGWQPGHFSLPCSQDLELRDPPHCLCSPRKWVWCGMGKVTSQTYISEFIPT